MLIVWLFDGDFGASYRLAAEGADFAAGHLHGAVFGGVDGEVAADGGAFAGALGHTDLADDDFAVFDRLATETLDAQALALAIAGVLAGTASFHM